MSAMEGVNRAYRPGKRTRTTTYRTGKRPATSKTVANLTKQVRLLKQSDELKWWDQAQASTTPIPVAGEVLSCLNSGIQEGNGDNERIDRKICMKSVQFRGKITWDATNPAAFYIRMLLVLDRQANGTEPNPSDILEDADINGMPEMGNSARFKILKDQLFTAQNGDGIENDPVHWYVPFKEPIVAEYKNNAGAIGDISSNALHLLVFSSGVNGNYPSFSGRTRVRFTG